MIPSPVVLEREGAADLPALLQGGARGQYCPLYFSTIVTMQTPANLKARLSNAEKICLFMNASRDLTDNNLIVCDQSTRQMTQLCTIAINTVKS